MMCQANCATLRYLSAEAPQLSAVVSQAHPTLRQPARRADVSKSRFAAKRCCGTCEASFSPYSRPPDAGFGRESRERGGWSLRLAIWSAKSLSSEQHRQDCSIGMADRVDTYATDHRGDRAVGFCLDPGRPVLEPKVRQPGQQYASRRGAVAFG
jgi:hypothetical protein